MYDFSYSTCKQQCSLLLQQVNYLVATKSHHIHRSQSHRNVGYNLPLTLQCTHNYKPENHDTIKTIMLMHVSVKMKMWYLSEHSSFYQHGTVSKHVAILIFTPTVVKLEVEGGGHVAMNSNSVKQYFIEHINDKVTVVWPLQNVNVNVSSFPMICACVLQRSSDVSTKMI